MSDQFNWHRDAADVAVPEQRAVAVYTNPNGELVIRQQAGWNDDDDAFVVVAVPNVRALVAALLREAGLQEAPPLALPAPEQSRNDATAAERQRRYREKKKQEAEAKQAPGLFVVER